MRASLFGPVVRAGARLGQFAPPEVWRSIHPLSIALLGDSKAAHRPRLDTMRRQRLLESYVDDIALLSELTGQDFSDWLSPADRGSFDERASVTQLSARR